MYYGPPLSWVGASLFEGTVNHILLSYFLTLGFSKSEYSRLSGRAMNDWWFIKRLPFFIYFYLLFPPLFFLKHQYCPPFRIVAKLEVTFALFGVMAPPC